MHEVVPAPLVCCCVAVLAKKVENVNDGYREAINLRRALIREWLIREWLVREWLVREWLIRE